MLDELKVLMIGNNPLEMATVFDHLKKISGKNVITETAFNLNDGIKRLARFTPNFIIIDDNIGPEGLSTAVNSLSHLKKTKNTPITILKNSNYREAFGGSVMNYILKDSLSAESLYSSLKNSLIAIRTQGFLKKVYNKRKGQLKRLLIHS